MLIPEAPTNMALIATRRRGISASLTPSTGSMATISAVPFIFNASSPSTFNFYISTTGSDANDGSLASPWAITAINTKRATYAGKTVGLLDGTYDLSAMPTYNGNSGSSGNSQILGVASGTSGAPTIIKAVNPRGAILNLKSGAGTRNRATAIGQFYDIGTGYVTIDGLTITGGEMYAIQFWGNYGAATWIPGYTVKNCHLYDFVHFQQDNGPAIELQGCDAALIQNNHIHDVTAVGGGGGCGVQMFACRRTVMEYNTIHDCEGGFNDKHGTGVGRTEANGCQYNYIYSCSQYAFLGFDNASSAGGEPFEKCSLHHNLIVDNTQNCIYTYVNEVTLSSTDFYSNTIVTSKVFDGLISRPAKSSSMLQSAWDNIISRTVTAGYQGDILISTGCWGTLDYNLYPGNFVGVVASPVNSFSGATTFTTRTLAQWRTSTSQESHSIQGSPTFVGGTGAAAYQLTAASLGYNQGKVGGVVGGATCHMGCWDGTVTQIGCDF